MDEQQEYTAWCRNMFSALNEGGLWYVPRSELTFIKRGDKFHYDARDVLNPAQTEDLVLITEQFKIAGIEIVIDTLMVDFSQI